MNRIYDYLLVLSRQSKVVELVEHTKEQWEMFTMSIGKNFKWNKLHKSQVTEEQCWSKDEKKKNQSQHMLQNAAFVAILNQSKWGKCSCSCISISQSYFPNQTTPKLYELWSNMYEERRNMVPQNYLWKLNCTSQRYQPHWKLTEKAFKKPIKKDYIKEKKPTKYMKKLSTKVGEKVLLALVTLKRYQWLEKCKLNEYSSVLGVKCFEVECAFSTKRRCKLYFYLSAHFLLVLCWKCITLK